MIYPIPKTINSTNKTLNIIAASLSTGFIRLIIEIKQKTPMNAFISQLSMPENNNMNPAIENDIIAANLFPNTVENVLTLLFMSGE